MSVEEKWRVEITAQCGGWDEAETGSQGRKLMYTAGLLLALLELTLDCHKERMERDA